MLCADMQGFSLHAALRCRAYDRKSLEPLCRSITRPARADERALCNAAGQVMLSLTAQTDELAQVVEVFRLHAGQNERAMVVA